MNQAAVGTVLLICALSGGAHLLLMYLVFLFHSWPPDNVQAICRKQESCARLVVRYLFKNLLHLDNGIGFDGVREGDHLIVWMVGVSDYESIATQPLRQALIVQALNFVKRRGLYFV